MTVAETAFSDGATHIMDMYPDSYVKAEWLGDHGVVTVTRDAVQRASKIASASAVQVEIAGVEGLGANAKNDLVLAAIDKLGDVLHDGDVVDVDLATGVVTIAVATFTNGGVDATSRAAAARLGPGAKVITVPGEGGSLYYDGDA